MKRQLCNKESTIKGSSNTSVVRPSIVRMALLGFRTTVGRVELSPPKRFQMLLDVLDPGQEKEPLRYGKRIF